MMKPWIRARTCGVRLGFTQLLAMRFRKVSPDMIVAACVSEQRLGRPVNTVALEAAYLAFGDRIRTGVELAEIARPEQTDLAGSSPSGGGAA
jgi:uncharacterized protein YqfA (UPF0365 family)